MNLTSEPAIRVGQPVQCGSRDGMPVEALRLCVSARQVSAAAASEDGIARLIAEACHVLDVAARLAADGFA
jgi:hypothetical protein